jgi:di/tricarboxylate transporter
MSYQTNLMIYGPGGYKMSDFIRVGVPVTVVYALAFAGAVALDAWIPWIKS